LTSWKIFKERWIVVSLYLVLSVFFLAGGLWSALMYGSVVKTQTTVVLENPVEGVTLHPNGSLELTFSIDAVNPTQFRLNIISLDWSVYLTNNTSRTEPVISLAEVYVGSTIGANVPNKNTTTFSYAAFVSNPAMLSKIRGFLNYSAAEGHAYTLESAPYIHEFRFYAWIDDFTHNYDTEEYLNELVRIDTRYITGGTT
jgi:hypothetical protein